MTMDDKLREAALQAAADVHGGYMNATKKRAVLAAINIITQKTPCQNFAPCPPLWFVTITHRTTFDRALQICNGMELKHDFDPPVTLDAGEYVYDWNKREFLKLDTPEAREEAQRRRLEYMAQGNYFGIRVK